MSSCSLFLRSQELGMINFVHNSILCCRVGESSVLVRCIYVCIYICCLLPAASTLLPNSCMMHDFVYCQPFCLDIKAYLILVSDDPQSHTTSKYRLHRSLLFAVYIFYKRDESMRVRAVLSFEEKTCLLLFTLTDRKKSPYADNEEP